MQEKWGSSKSWNKGRTDTPEGPDDNRLCWIVYFLGLDWVWLNKISELIMKWVMVLDDRTWEWGWISFGFRLKLIDSYIFHEASGWCCSIVISTLRFHCIVSLSKYLDFNNFGPNLSPGFVLAAEIRYRLRAFGYSLEFRSMCNSKLCFLEGLPLLEKGHNWLNWSLRP